MSGGSSSSHCKGSSAFKFAPTMSGDAHVDVSGAHTGNNDCTQGATSTGGSGGLDVTAVPALMMLHMNTQQPQQPSYTLHENTNTHVDGGINFSPNMGGSSSLSAGMIQSNPITTSTHSFYLTKDNQLVLL